MPIIDVKWFTGRTQQQKADLAKRWTDAIIEIAGVPRDSVEIIFHDTQPSYWAAGGELHQAHE